MRSQGTQEPCRHRCAPRGNPHGVGVGRHPGLPAPLHGDRQVVFRGPAVRRAAPPPAFTVPAFRHVQLQARVATNLARRRGRPDGPARPTARGANWRPKPGVASHFRPQTPAADGRATRCGSAFRPRCQVPRPGQPRTPARRPVGLAPATALDLTGALGADVEVLIAGAAPDPAPWAVGSTKRGLVVTFSATKLRPTCIIQRPTCIIRGLSIFVWR